jgi:ribonucleoside-diphosphate reductase alpha chain
VEDIPEACPSYLIDAARECGEQALELGEQFGYRNAQVTVLAPTGTIGFMMDCDTTGVEPDIALVKYKTLAGGGMLKIVNQTVPQALRQLKYTPEQIEAIIQHIDEHDTIEGAPHLAENDLPVFDCAFKPRNGKRFIAYMGHLRMMAAVQPFLSGAISKTVNMPEEATREQIMETYQEGWLLGLKALAIYRDGCKRSQPVQSGKTADKAIAQELIGEDRLQRRRLPDTRQSLTHKFSVGGHEGYLTVGLYEDGSPGELFIIMAKEGSTIGGLMDCFGTAVSVCLQYGVPLDTLIKKFAHTRFDPSGWTGNKEIPIAKSPMDYIFRWLSLTFLEEPKETKEQEEHLPTTGKTPQTLDAQFSHFMEDAPACDQCGAITVRNGSCYRCYNCGASMGCS